MKYRRYLVPHLLALITLAGCASTKVATRQQLVSGPLPRPAQIWVYDFAATPTDVPADSALAGQYVVSTAPPTAEQIATGRQVGADLRRSWSNRFVTWDAGGAGRDGNATAAQRHCHPRLSSFPSMRAVPSNAWQSDLAPGDPSCGPRSKATR